MIKRKSPRNLYKDRDLSIKTFLIHFKIRTMDNMNLIEIRRLILIAISKSNSHIKLREKEAQNNLERSHIRKSMKRIYQYINMNQVKSMYKYIRTQSPKKKQL
jgi:hypothetical protein